MKTERGSVSATEYSCKFLQQNRLATEFLNSFLLLSFDLSRFSSSVNPLSHIHSNWINVTVFPQKNLLCRMRLSAPSHQRSPINLYIIFFIKFSEIWLFFSAKTQGKNLDADSYFNMLFINISFVS